VCVHTHISSMWSDAEIDRMKRKEKPAVSRQSTLQIKRRTRSPH